MYKDENSMHTNYGDYDYAKDAAAFVKLLHEKKLLEPDVVSTPKCKTSLSLLGGSHSGEGADSPR